MRAVKKDKKRIRTWASLAPLVRNRNKMSEKLNQGDEIKGSRITVYIYVYFQ
jgi:hypothetical protein